MTKNGNNEVLTQNAEEQSLEGILNGILKNEHPGIIISLTPESDLNLRIAELKSSTETVFEDGIIILSRMQFEPNQTRNLPLGHQFAQSLLQNDIDLLSKKRRKNPKEYIIKTFDLKMLQIRDQDEIANDILKQGNLIAILLSLPTSKLKRLRCGFFIDLDIEKLCSSYSANDIEQMLNCVNDPEFIITFAKPLPQVTNTFGQAFLSPTPIFVFTTEEEQRLSQKFRDEGLNYQEATKELKRIDAKS
jgi:hypothetical protein